ncbi:putative coiled-coil domain-containing protein 195 [Pyxicephalus adspersus]|uniref:putative coiled-coil domain-containing protein 195 n=1 Tax=Pyxicephalus adspersus TaxID=30357 RepID=UPI003B5BC4F7
MEGDTQLLQVIKEMRSEINKLEKENKELRGELHQTDHMERETRPGIKCELQQNKEVTCKGLLLRNVSVGANDLIQEQTGAKMTVRRYSMSSLLSGAGYSKHNANIKRHSSNGTPKINRPMQDTESDNGNQQAKETAEEMLPELLVNTIPKTRSFQEYMHKCRGRVKVVTFLLPMDMRAYAENQKAFQNMENQSANHLSTIIEKDP